MTMLHEIISEKTLSNARGRRWFESEKLDLVIWQDDSHDITSFQIHLREAKREHAITWKASSGFVQEVVDDGESRLMHHKSSPIMASSTKFNPSRFALEFSKLCGDMDKQIATFVLQKLAVLQSQT